MRKKIPISNMCLGGCMITSKAKINIIWNFFFTPSPLQRPSKWQNVDISLRGKQCIVLRTRTFFCVLAHCVNFILEIEIKIDEDCNLEADIGPCRSSMPRYFYNSKTGKCELFTYGGCSGNRNNFETARACEKKCILGPM